jgi:hypothetical protein
MLKSTFAGSLVLGFFLPLINKDAAMAAAVTNSNTQYDFFICPVFSPVKVKYSGITG